MIFYTCLAKGVREHANSKNLLRAAETRLILDWASTDTRLRLDWDLTETRLRLDWDLTETRLRLDLNCTQSRWASDETKIRLEWDSNGSQMSLDWDSRLKGNLIETQISDIRMRLLTRRYGNQDSNHCIDTLIQQRHGWGAMNQIGQRLN